jgi:hypothetical protein
MNQKIIVVLISLSAFLFTACDGAFGLESDEGSNDGGTGYEGEYGIIDSESRITGKLYILEDGTVSTVDPTKQFESLLITRSEITVPEVDIPSNASISGSITVYIGDEKVTLNAVDFTQKEITVLSKTVTYFEASIDYTTKYYGTISFVTMTDLVINSMDFEYYSSGTFVITPNTDINLNDLDADGTENVDAWISKVEPVLGSRITGAPSVSDFTLAEKVENPYASFTATLNNIDLPLCSILINKHFLLVKLDNVQNALASIDEIADLIPGENTVKVIAFNKSGIGVSEEKTVTYEEPGHVKGASIYLTLTWDTPTSDMDLHVWYYTSVNRSAQWHCAWWNMDVTGRPDTVKDGQGNLDVDDIEGFGPEHFTLYDYQDGYYVVVINSYELDKDKNASVNLSVNVAGDEAFYGPHLFTTENLEAYPVNNNESWVRFVDIKISGGKAEFLKPDYSIDPPRLEGRSVPYRK